MRLRRGPATVIPARPGSQRLGPSLRPDPGRGPRGRHHEPAPARVLPVSAPTPSPPSSASTTCGSRSSSTPSRPPSAACSCAARRAPPSRRSCARSPRCCRPSTCVEGCRFSCAPGAPDPACPDARRARRTRRARPARLVELPVGASEDRLVGSLDLERALTERRLGVRAGAARRRPPRRALRRRGQPAARPPRRPAARRGGARHARTSSARACPCGTPPASCSSAR